MPLPQENLYTLEDIYDLPNGERAELLDGTFIIWLLPVPSIRKSQENYTQPFAITSVKKAEHTKPLSLLLLYF